MCNADSNRYHNRIIRKRKNDWAHNGPCIQCKSPNWKSQRTLSTANGVFCLIKCNQSSYTIWDESKTPRPRCRTEGIDSWSEFSPTGVRLARYVQFFRVQQQGPQADVPSQVCPWKLTLWGDTEGPTKVGSNEFAGIRWRQRVNGLCIIYQVVL